MSIGEHEQIPWQDWHCSSCRALLLRVVPAPGMRIAIRCRRCNALMEHSISASPTSNGAHTDDLKHLLHRLDDKVTQLIRQT